MKSALRPSPAVLLDAGMLTVLAVLALLGLRDTYVGWTFLVVGTAGILAGAVVGHLLRALGQPVVVTAAATLVVYFASGILVLPGPKGPASLRGLAEVSVLGWKELLTTLPPVDPDDPLIVLPYLIGLLCGVSGYLLARGIRVPRRLSGPLAPLHAAAPLAAPLLVVGVAIAFGTRRPGAEVVDGVGLAVGMLVWVAARWHRLAAAPVPAVEPPPGVPAPEPPADRPKPWPRLLTAAGVLAVAGTGAVFVGPAMPGAAASRVVLRDQITPPFDINDYPSPLVGFRKYTADANLLSDQTLFTVTGLPAGAMVRIASLDDYDGTVWGATSGAADGTFQRVGSHLGAPSGRAVTVQITIAPAYAAAPDLNAWIPGAGSISQLDFSGPRGAALASDLRYNLAASDGIVPGRFRAGDTYTMRTVLSDPALPADAQPFGRPALSDPASALLANHVAAWTGGASGLNAQLAAVADYLRTQGAYSDGGPGETQYLPGHYVGRLATFVNGPQPVGDDEQYAAVFALAANYLGIPARVVFGAVLKAGGVVRGRDVHAWVEVRVSDGTWVPIPQGTFMPDPSKRPNKQPPAPRPNAPARNVPPPNLVHRPPSTLDTGQGNQTVTDRTSVTDPWWKPLLGVLLAVAVWGGPPVAVVAAVAGGIIGYKRRRRRRRRNHPSVANRFATGWFELVDRARDAGVTMPAGYTRLQEARLLTRWQATGAAAAAVRPASLSTTLAADALSAITLAVPTPAEQRREALSVEIRALVEDADTAIYGPGEPTEAQVDAYWQRIDRVCRSLHRRSGRWPRLRTTLSLRSLAPRGQTPTGALGEVAS